MRKITFDEARAELQAQGVEKQDMAVICPICRTVQSMASLIRAGAPKDKAQSYLAFSCEGRFSGAGPVPSSKDKSERAALRRAIRGCDWTLGGLLSLHELEIVDQDGNERPSFEIASGEQARELIAKMLERADA